MGPWSASSDTPVLADPERHAASQGPSASILEFGYAVYANYITKIDGARCEHRPTCSRYAIQSVRKHGFVLGALLSLDRLVRGTRSSVLRDLPLHKVEDGRPYFHDPLEANDSFL